MGGWIVALARFGQIFCVAGATLQLVTGVRAQESPTPTVCRFEIAGTGKVRAVTDGRSFILDDGREIRLAGIEVPLPSRPGETGARAYAGTAAHDALGSIIAGQNVEFRQHGANRPLRSGTGFCPGRAGPPAAIGGT